MGDNTAWWAHRIYAAAHQCPPSHVELTDDGLDTVAELLKAMRAEIRAETEILDQIDERNEAGPATPAARERALSQYFAPDDPAMEPFLPAAVAFRAGWDRAVLHQLDGGPCAEKVPGCTRKRRHTHASIKVRSTEY